MPRSPGSVAVVERVSVCFDVVLWSSMLLTCFCQTTYHRAWLKVFGLRCCSSGCVCQVDHAKLGHHMPQRWPTCARALVPVVFYRLGAFYIVVSVGLHISECGSHSLWWMHRQQPHPGVGLAGTGHATSRLCCVVPAAVLGQLSMLWYKHCTPVSPSP